MIRLMSLFVAGIAMVAGSPVLAQDGAPAARYQMQPVEGGIARLDTQTGEIAFCRTGAGTIACDDAPHGAGSQDTARLDALEARIEVLESRGRALVERDDADYAIEQMKKLFSGFADIVRDLERDVTRPDPEEAPVPNRT